MSLSPRRRQEILARLGLMVAGILVSCLILETALRLFPALLPSGAFYGSGRYESAIGLHVHNSPVIYNKVRFLERTPNTIGFMDVEHPERKPSGALRIGVFGDSYVEAIQVPLEQTFFRLLSQRLSGKSVEVLAFGVSGWGTVDSLVNYRHQADRFDLDIIIYLFVKNDPGDNSQTLQSQRRGIFTPTHTASLIDSPEGFVIHRNHAPGNDAAYRRLARRLKTHSILARVLHSRLQLFSSARSRPKLAERPNSQLPRHFSDQESLPSTWPAELLKEAKELTYRLLGKWKTETEQSKRIFLLLYVPKGEQELSGMISAADSWLPWVQETCEALDIDLIDPSEELRARQRTGDLVYNDHWSPPGHEVVAKVVLEHLEPLLEKLRASSSQAPPGSLPRQTKAALPKKAGT